MTRALSPILAAALLWAAPAAAQTTPELSGAMADLKAKTAAFAQMLGGRRAAAELASEEAQVLEALRQAVGIKEETSNRTYSRYSIRGEENFIISGRGFASRAAASDFCSQIPGYRLGNPMLSMYLAMAGLPFAALRAQNIVKEQVLAGRSGLVFWVSGDKDLPESQLSMEPDAVWVLLDGCGPNCSGLSTLRAVNEALTRVGRPARRLPAVCARADSRDF